MSSNDDMIWHFETKEHFLSAGSQLTDKPPSSRSTLRRAPPT